MAAGRTISLAELNNTWGALATSLHAVMANILEAKAVLDGYTGGDLETDFGFTTGDAATLKSAAADMGDLASIFSGGTPVATLPYDYRTFAKQLLGTGLY